MQGTSAHSVTYYNNLINLQEPFSPAMAYAGVMPLPGAVDDSPVPGDSGTLRKLLCRCRSAVFIQICDSICALTLTQTLYWTMLVCWNCWVNRVLVLHSALHCLP